VQAALVIRSFHRHPSHPNNPNQKCKKYQHDQQATKACKASGLNSLAERLLCQKCASWIGQDLSAAKIMPFPNLLGSTTWSCKKGKTSLLLEHTGASCQCLGGDVIAHLLLQRFTNETRTGEESMMISMISIA